MVVFPVPSSEIPIGLTVELHEPTELSKRVIENSSYLAAHIRSRTFRYLFQEGSSRYHSPLPTTELVPTIVGIPKIPKSDTVPGIDIHLKLSSNKARGGKTK